MPIQGFTGSPTECPRLVSLTRAATTACTGSPSGSVLGGTTSTVATSPKVLHGSA